MWACDVGFILACRRVNLAFTGTHPFLPQAEASLIQAHGEVMKEYWEIKKGHGPIHIDQVFKCLDSMSQHSDRLFCELMTTNRFLKAKLIWPVNWSKFELAVTSSGNQENPYRIGTGAAMSLEDIQKVAAEASSLAVYFDSPPPSLKGSPCYLAPNLREPAPGKAMIEHVARQRQDLASSLVLGKKRRIAPTLIAGDELRRKLDFGRAPPAIRRSTRLGAGGAGDTGPIDTADYSGAGGAAMEAAARSAFSRVDRKTLRGGITKKGKTLQFKRVKPLELPSDDDAIDCTSPGEAGHIQGRQMFMSALAGHEVELVSSSSEDEAPPPPAPPALFQVSKEICTCCVLLMEDCRCDETHLTCVSIPVVAAPVAEVMQPVECAPPAPPRLSSVLHPGPLECCGTWNGTAERSCGGLCICCSIRYDRTNLVPTQPMCARCQAVELREESRGETIALARALSEAAAKPIAAAEPIDSAQPSAGAKLSAAEMAMAEAQAAWNVDILRITQSWPTTAHIKTYLDALRDSGVINMLEAEPYLRARFPCLSVSQAIAAFNTWINTYVGDSS